MASKTAAVVCSHCGGTHFREEKIVQLDNTVMVTKGMKIPAQNYERSSCSCVLRAYSGQRVRNGQYALQKPAE